MLVDKVVSHGVLANNSDTAMYAGMEQLSKWMVDGGSRVVTVRIRIYI